ncbi:MAG: glycosyltransferase [Solirubrobacteraceae bacterium]|nr:glycosyltransferase [Patulibacter sp.]
MALQEHESIGPDAAQAAAKNGTSEKTGMQDASDLRAAVVAASIMRRADAAVAAHDAEAFAAALAEIPGISHEQRRHLARLRTIENLLQLRAGITPTNLARLLQQGLAGLATWLEENPLEPSLLGYAGVICVELGLYREAEELLVAASNLNPELPGIDLTIETVRSRRKAKTSVPGLPGDVKHHLTRLRPRLQRAAAAAVPPTDLTLSLCMIVRDEEEWLGRCLEAIKDGVDEMIIVDTGSRDRTVEIAKSFGAKVLFHEWTGNFGEARNIGLEAATGDWFIWIDADEVFVGDDALRLKELTGHTWREAFFIEEINHTGSLDDGTAAKHNALRMFRNRPQYRFEGAVHEQLAYALPGYLPERIEHTDLRMDHYGYLDQVRVDKGKESRNLDLLKEQQASGEDGAFLHFNLGSEYAGNDEPRSLKHFRTAFDKVVDDPNFRLYGFLPSLCSRYVRALRVAEAFEEMDRVTPVIHDRFDHFTDVYFEQALAAQELGKPEEARALFEKCVELGDAPAKYSSTVGCGSYLAELRLVQLDLEEQKVDSAEERLRRTRHEFPQVFALIDPFIALLLMRGKSPDEVYAELTEGEAELIPTGWFMLAVNLQERGHREQAERAFREALERRPSLDIARIGLADALLVQGRVEEAAEQAVMVPADARYGHAGVRTAIFAKLALEQPEIVGTEVWPLVEQLDKTELPEADRAVLRAWAVAAGGPGEAPKLDRTAVDSITPMMDGLLRLGAADAFADLVGVLSTTGIGRRTEHEVLATLLLRRGLPEMAGDEWIAAVEESGPDSAAFAGLAECARLRGMDEDARNLASAALELEPGQKLATQVLEAVSA